MKKWILLLLALALVTNLAAMGTACKPKAPEKPAAEEVKPPEAPAPAEPAATPAPPAPAETPKK